MGEQLCQALLCDYVPTTMAVYGVFRPRLITYDVQWRATYFLSIDYAPIVSDGKDKRRSDAARSAFVLSTRLPLRSSHKFARLGNCLPMAGTVSNSPVPAKKTTGDFKRQPETRSTQSPHPVWFYIYPDM
jgi:hypothetical protein